MGLIIIIVYDSITYYENLCLFLIGLNIDWNDVFLAELYCI